MIVSILQLMGFPLGKPVHSRAEQGPSRATPTKQNGGQEATEQANARSARRPEVKASEKKSTKSAAAKPKAAAKATKVVASKAEVKVAKPDAKAAKPTAKAPAKVAVKAAAKAPAKAPIKSAPASVKAVAPVAKSAKAAKAAPSSPAKVVAAAPKAAAKSPAKTPAKVTVPVESVAVTSSRLPVPPVSAGVAQGLRAGRPSSRLAQLTVPSMAQSIASTAAKASYSQSIPSPVIVPALPSSIKKDAKLANNWKTKPVAELTDAELLAMSDDDYMNEVQLAAFRLKLEGLKLDILNNAGETTEHLREDTSVVPDPADRATIEEEHALELRTRDRERKLLKKIEQSITRIDAGDYGYCDETGEPIGVGRLLARPTATLSLEAQQRRELKQKMFGD